MHRPSRGLCPCCARVNPTPTHSIQLGRDVKSSMIEIESRFDSLAASCGELSQPRTAPEKKLLKQTEKDLGGIRKKAKALHGKLAVIFSELPEADDFQTGLASRIASPCSLDELKHELERTLPQFERPLPGLRSSQRETWQNIMSC